MEQVEIHAVELGRMPLLLVNLVSEMEIGNIGRIAASPQYGEIHVDVEIGRESIETGFWQESLFHETVHTSLENAIRWDHKWFAAQEADGTFISEYAQFLPNTEDIAETFLMWFAVRYRPERLPGDVLETVLNTVPNRLAFFDAQGTT